MLFTILCYKLRSFLCHKVIWLTLGTTSNICGNAETGGTIIGVFPNAFPAWMTEERLGLLLGHLP